MPQETPKDWADEAVEGLPALATAKETAKALRTTRRTLYRWVAAGRISSVKRPGGDTSSLLFPKASIVAYLRSLEVET